MPVSAPATAPRKTRSGAITRTRVTAAAFAIVDADGADALSARRLAHALDCAAMSLYHHVSSMDEVLDDVVGLLLQKCVPAPLDGRPLRRQLRQAADAYLALALRHPRVFALAAGRRWVSPSAYALAGTLAAMFQAGGLSSREAGRAARSLGAYLNGAGMALAGWKLRDDADTAPPSRDDSPEDRRLRKQFDPTEVRRDLDSGLEVLIEGLLAGGRRSDKVG